MRSSVTHLIIVSPCLKITSFQALAKHLPSTSCLSSQRLVVALNIPARVRGFGHAKKFVRSCMEESQIKECSSSSPLPHDLTAKLVYSYLIHNCYSATAESFGSALRIQPLTDVKMTDVHDERIGTGGLVGSSPEIMYLQSLQKPLATLEKRQALVGLILTGSVSVAKQMFSVEFPHIFNSKSKQVQDVLFILSCQEFIELVAKDSESAVEYVKIELVKFSDVSYRNELEELVTILAYTNPQSSRVGHYLTMNRREMVAKKLNSLILGTFAHFKEIVYDGWSADAPLEMIIKQISSVRDCLHVEDKKVICFDSLNIRYHILDGILVIQHKFSLSENTFFNLVAATSL